MSLRSEPTWVQNLADMMWPQVSDPKPYFLRGERRWDSNVKIPGKRAEVGRHDRVSDTSQARGEGEKKEAKKTSDISSQVSHGLQVSSTVIFRRWTWEPLFFSKSFWSKSKWVHISGQSDNPQPKDIWALLFPSCLSLSCPIFVSWGTSRSARSMRKAGLSLFSPTKSFFRLTFYTSKIKNGGKLGQIALNWGTSWMGGTI